MEDAHIKVIEGLIKKTTEGKALWRLTRQYGQMNVYTIDLKKGAVNIYKQSSKSIENDIIFQIYNDRGDSIIKYSYYESDSENIHNLLNKLYHVAEENYFKKKETINSILEEIESDDIIGNLEENPEEPF